MHLNHYKGHWNIQHMCNWDVLFSRWAEIIQNLSHCEGPGLLHVFVFVHGSNPKPKKAAAKTCVMVSRCPCVLSAVICQCTVSPASVHSCIYHILMSTSYLFSVNVLCVKDIWPGQSDCFLFKSNVNGSFRECTCILNVSSDKNMPTLDDPWRLFRKKKKRRVRRIHLLFFKFKYRVLNVVLECWETDPQWAFLSTLQTKDSFTSDTSWYSFLSRLEIGW